MTEAQARAAINTAGAASPKLCDWRAHVLPAMKTSDLIGYLITPDSLVQVLELHPAHERDQLVLMCAMLALGDEIDRRIPIP